jgi:hypothetical protein
MVIRRARTATLLSLYGSRRRSRLARPAVAPSFARRRVHIVRGRGGFFGDVFKGVKKVVSVVSKVPVIGAVAKTVVSSVPVLGGVITAVGAIKSAVNPPTVANTGNTTATTGAPPVGQPQASTAGAAPSPRRKRATKAKAKARRRKKGASSRGSAKQRAARARFARAAKKGRIKKGQKL